MTTPLFPYTKSVIVLLLLLCSGKGWGQYTGTGTFTKITSVDDLTDGYYVITNETDAFVMTNGRSGNATTGYFVSAEIAPVSGTLTNPSAANVWRIETNSSGRTIYNEVIEKYVGWSSGNAASIEDAPADTNRWVFSFADNKWTVNNVAASVRQLSYNSVSPRFAAYGNANQHELQLYKLEVPSTPCSGTPSPGNTIASVNPVESGGETVLSLQNATSGSGVTYQWQSSTDGTNFSNITGATSSTYTATVTAVTWYQCIVTCDGNSGTSTPVEV